MENRQELLDVSDLGTYIGRIGRRILLRGEMLRSIGHMWFEGDCEESRVMMEEMGLELNQIGQQLKLLRDQLCHRCEMLQVEEKTTILSEHMSVKEE